MSQTNTGVQGSEMNNGKREIKLTAKALANKTERLQQERKMVVNKIKTLIPEMKSLMKTRDNVSYVRHQMESLINLWETATLSHNTLIPLLPEDEQNRQNEWFASIMEYSNTFKEAVKQWLSGQEELIQKDSLDPAALNEQATLPSSSETVEPVVEMPVLSSINKDEIQDDVKPSDSVSNIGSRVTGAQTSATGRKSAVSSTAFARLKAEADLAALITRQRLLKEKHQLQEEEEHLRKRKAMCL